MTHTTVSVPDSATSGELVPTGGNDLVLSLQSVSKSFGPVRVLHDVSLTCKPGEFHALIGENGAGKSTLLKIACGALRADEGQISVGGVVAPRPSVTGMRRMGLLTAYQDTSLVPELTALENLMLSFQGVRRVGMSLPTVAAQEALEKYALPFSPTTKVADLSPASRQLLEVVRAMMNSPKVLLLDEPTAALDMNSAALLADMIQGIQSEGAAVLYVSHRLDEIKRLADRISVIRDGRIQGTRDRSNWTIAEALSLMVGAPTELEFPPKPGIADDAPEALRAEDVSGTGFGPVGMNVKAGEIVGIAGAESNGQRELLRALAGVNGYSGELRLHGQPVEFKNPTGAARAGVAFLSGDRAAESVFPQLSVMANTVIGARSAPLGVVSRSAEMRAFREMAEELAVVHSSPDQPAGELSGGNQQKLVVARAMLGQSTVWLVDEPTQGVDVNARMAIYRLLRAEADRGTAIIVNSSDSSELEGLADRVYVLSRGRVVRYLQGDDVEESTIVASFVDVAGNDETKVGDSVAADVPAISEGIAGPERSSSPSRRRFGFHPLFALVLLMVALATWAAVAEPDTFLQSYNLNSWLIAALPLATLAIGLQMCFVVGEFDVSTGSTMSLSVVVMSFLATQVGFVQSLPGVLATLAVGAGVGVLNAFVVQLLRVGAVVGTIGTMGLISGLAIILRPEPGGLIGLGITDVVTAQVGFIPISLIVVVIFALLIDAWRVRTVGGLSARAVGLATESARRTGIAVGAIKTASFVLCGMLAALAGIFLAVQIGVGSNAVGVSYPLLGFTACFLAGAAMSGGKGSFSGAVLGALFLTLITNVVPILQIPTAVNQIATGVLTVVAVAAFAGRRRVGGARR